MERPKTRKPPTKKQAARSIDKKVTEFEAFQDIIEDKKRVRLECLQKKGLSEREIQKQMSQFEQMLYTEMEGGGRKCHRLTSRWPDSSPEVERPAHATNSCRCATYAE